MRVILIRKPWIHLQCFLVSDHAILLQKGRNFSLVYSNKRLLFPLLLNKVLFNNAVSLRYSC